MGSGGNLAFLGRFSVFAGVIPSHDTLNDVINAMNLIRSAKDKQSVQVRRKSAGWDIN